MAKGKKKLSLPVTILIVELVVIALLSAAVFAFGSVGGASSTEVVAGVLSYWVMSITFGIAGTGTMVGGALIVGLFFWVNVILSIGMFVTFLIKSKKSLIALLAYVLGFGLVSAAVAFVYDMVIPSLSGFSPVTLAEIAGALIAVVAAYVLSILCLKTDSKINNEAKADEKLAAASLTEDQVREIVRDELAKNKVEPAPAAEEAPAEEEEGDFLTADDIRGIIQAEVRAAVADEMVNYQPAPAEEEEPAVIESGDDFGEEEETPAPVEEPAPAEEPAVVVAPVVEEEGEEAEEGEAAPGRVIIKKTFANKIKFLSDEQKEIYARIKNELLSYKCTNRAAKMNETFRKSGIVCRIVVSGKSIRVNLPLDPNDLEKYPENRYHQKDYGDKKSYADTPFGMNVKSNRAATKAIELIQGILEEKGAKKVKNFEPQDFTEELLPDGSAILEVTAQADKLVEEGPVTEEMAATINDSVLDYIPTVDLPATDNEEVSNVNVQVAAGYTTDIKRDTLRATNSWYSSVNDKIFVKSNGEPLEAVVRVECDDIDPLTAKMILMRGGKIVKINRVKAAE